MADGDGPPSAPLPRPKRFRLGSGIVADPVRHSIIRDGRAIAVEPRVMQLLTYFAARPGKVISKGELREQVWGTHVVDEAVHRAISLLRSALGDTARQSKIIETVPRHGYRLLFSPAFVHASSTGPLKSRGLGVTAAVAGVAALALLVSPALRFAPAEAPVHSVVVPEAAAIAAVETPEIAKAERQLSPRAVAAAPRLREIRPYTQKAPAAAPQAPAAASETGTQSAYAPETPVARARQPAEAPAPRAKSPVAERVSPVRVAS